MKYVITLLILSILLSGCGSTLSKNAVASVNGECSENLYPIKGNRNDKGEWIYHMPRGQYYKVTNAEECFANEYDAQQAKYRKSKR